MVAIRPTAAGGLGRTWTVVVREQARARYLARWYECEVRRRPLDSDNDLIAESLAAALPVRPPKCKQMDFGGVWWILLGQQRGCRPILGPGRSESAREARRGGQGAGGARCTEGTRKRWSIFENDCTTTPATHPAIFARASRSIAMWHMFLPPYMRRSRYLLTRRRLRRNQALAWWRP